MHLTIIDWTVIIGYFIFNLAIGLYYHRKATGSVDDYFVSGRSVAWWLAGTSMVATTFAADTPLAVTGLVARNGIAGNWVWWSMVMSGMLTVFFYAKLWRRAGVLTDVEFAEIRYAGKPAAFLRGFRAFYLGIMNFIVMGWVNLAMIKILMQIMAIDKLHAVIICIGIMVLTASISTLSGLWGVLVMDLFQFFLKMSMVIILAVFAVDAVGGMGGLMEKLHAVDLARNATQGGSITSFIPDLNSPWMPLITFLVYVAVNWWATWYPGSEPGGGGYVAQRIFSAKNEKHSLLATLWFNIAHFALRPWPWILVALVAVVKYQGDAAFAKDPESGYIRIMIDCLPAYLRGLMIAAFAAAYMSTIGTQLNTGASYFVNDLYRRFMVKGREERHYVRASQAATVVIMIISAIISFYMDSISGAWKFLIAIGAGTGLVFILRWFWWRINAWSEVSAMITAFIVSTALQFGMGLSETDPRQYAYLVLITTAATTVVWISVTFLTKPEPEEVLLAFYRKVRPSAALWGPVAKKAEDVAPPHDEVFSFMDWIAGCLMIYMTLFGVGNIIFGKTALGVVFLAIAAVSFWVIMRDLSRRGWETLAQ
ncbi:MAG: sodium:solute symporter family protein [Candidatus Eremiobacteraeota bacterium]|nr:sodium:solute symporter family protein [Candidatus Eremiobacteraeota bacterium]